MTTSKDMLPLAQRLADEAQRLLQRYPTTISSQLLWRHHVRRQTRQRAAVVACTSCLLLAAIVWLAAAAPQSVPPPAAAASHTQAMPLAHPSPSLPDSPPTVADPAWPTDTVYPVAIVVGEGNEERVIATGFYVPGTMQRVRLSDLPRAERQAIRAVLGLGEESLLAGPI